MGHRLNDSTVWPFPVHEGIPLKSMIQGYNPAPIPYHRFPEQLVNYLLQICLTKSYSPKSFESTLRITARFIQKTDKLHSLQLISLVTLMLTTKFFDYYYFTVPQIHQLSNHQFTNKDIHQMEQIILITLDFNLFIEPQIIQSPKNLPPLQSYPLQSYHSPLYEVLMLAMEMTSILIPIQKQSLYYETVNKVFLLYFHMMYTRDFKRPFLNRLCDPKFVICLILNASMIILTQTKGDFPQILWMKQLIGFKGKANGKEFEDQFEQIVIKIMEIILGKQMKDIKNSLKEFWIKQN